MRGAAKLSPVASEPPRPATRHARRSPSRRTRAGDSGCSRRAWGPWTSWAAAKERQRTEREGGARDRHVVRRGDEDDVAEELSRRASAVDKSSSSCSSRSEVDVETLFRFRSPDCRPRRYLRREAAARGMWTPGGLQSGSERADDPRAGRSVTERIRAVLRHLLLAGPSNGHVAFDAARPDRSRHVCCRSPWFRCGLPRASTPDWAISSRRRIGFDSGRTASGLNADDHVDLDLVLIPLGRGAGAEDL